MKKKRYSYDGSVLEFDKVIANRWKGSTFATTPQRAKTNLAYQFKQQTGRIAGCKISLPGKLIEVI